MECGCADSDMASLGVGCLAGFISRSDSAIPYAQPTRCPVLPLGPGICLCAPYVVPGTDGTDRAYGATSFFVALYPILLNQSQLAGQNRWSLLPLLRSLLPPPSCLLYTSPSPRDRG
eukprot:1147186-Rhodomonas_salina.1